MSNIITIKDTRPGDVLLCRNIDSGRIGQKITDKTGSNYSHAAICLDSKEVAESMPPKGVSLVSLSDFLQRYDFLCVFRQPDAWNSQQRIDELRLFCEKSSKPIMNYGYIGVARLQKEKEKSSREIYKNLKAYFDDPDNHVTKKKRVYFCSEFVAESFVQVGFIKKSAAIIYKAETISPGDLGKDPTFGTFVGYLPGKTAKIPSDDEFYQATPYHDCFDRGDGT